MTTNSFISIYSYSIYYNKRSIFLYINILYRYLRTIIIGILIFLNLLILLGEIRESFGLRVPAPIRFLFT